MTSERHNQPGISRFIHPMMETFGGSGVVHVFAHSTASLGHMPGLEEKEAQSKYKVERMFFDPQTGQGMLPYNTGSLSQGRFRAVFFGATRDEVMKLHEESRAKA
jgi:hypothetical protein